MRGDPLVLSLSKHLSFRDCDAGLMDVPNARLEARLVLQHQTSLSKELLGNMRLSCAECKIISCNALALCTSDTMSLLVRRGRIATPTHGPKHISNASLHEHAHTVLIGTPHLFSLR